MIIFKIAAAQSVSIRGNVQENIERHRRLIELAAENSVQCIIFPELSLTGYEPNLADTLAFTADDKRIDSLREVAEKYKMLIIAGAPYRAKSGLYIGAFIIFPDRSVSVYSKRFLHPGEDKFFSPGNTNHTFDLEQEKLSIAICADISNPLHADEASQAGSTIYAAGALISTAGYETDAAILRGYAKKYSMLVLMANHGGASGGYNSAGRSALWSPTGNLLAEFAGTREGLVVAAKENGMWTGKTIIIN
jgi:predicted amidohydrolase